MRACSNSGVKMKTAMMAIEEAEAMLNENYCGYDRNVMGVK